MLTILSVDSLLFSLFSLRLVFEKQKARRIIMITFESFGHRGRPALHGSGGGMSNSKRQARRARRTHFCLPLALLLLWLSSSLLLSALVASLLINHVISCKRAPSHNPENDAFSELSSWRWTRFSQACWSDVALLH